MALQTSGAISLSQIATHFGGSGSHSLSEYHALAGKGVSGIPASGAISFSHFHGKSNQVTTSVWVSSGYNQTSFQEIGRANPNAGQGYWYYQRDVFAFGLDAVLGIGTIYYYKNNATRSYQITSHWVGTRRYSRGTYRYTTGSSTGWYDLIIYDNVTTWVDTSDYQNQTTTAQITT